MNMQQAQGKPSTWPKRVRIILFVCALLGLIAAAIFWLLNIQPVVFSTLFAALGVIIGFIALIPLIFPAKTPDAVSPSVTVNTPVNVNNVVPTAPINIYNMLPPAQSPQPPQLTSIPTISAPGALSQASHGVSSSSFANPLSLRALPLPGGARHIQRRGKNVKEVYAQLIDAGVAAVALCGIGGVGKSTLAALVFAHTEQERKAARGPFAGETVLLRINENTTFLELAANIFACVEKSMPPDFASLSPQAQVYALFHALNTAAAAETPRLIVLDQFENLLDPQTGRALTTNVGVGEWLDALNSQPCASRVLLTSRLHPHGARDNAPAALRLYHVNDLSIAEGVELLRGLGVTGDEEGLRRAVERCNGHALSLTLLGTLLQIYTVNLASLLKDAAYTQLWEGRIEENLLKSIFGTLLAPSRGLLCAFSVYREAVPIEAALAALSGVSKKQALVILGNLLEQHLVQALSAQSTTGHYQLHPIVAAYARRHFALNEAANGEAARKTAHAQAAQYYLQVAAANNVTPGGVKGVGDAQPLIEAVWQLCQAEQLQEAYELMQREDLFDKLSLWGANTALLDLCQLLLSGNWAYTPRHRAFLCFFIASISNVLGHKQEALRYYEQALRIRREVGDRGQEGVVLNDLGRVYDDLGQKQEALGYYEQALRIGREVGDRGGEGTTLWYIGAVYFGLGRNGVALACFLQAKQIFEQVQSPHVDDVAGWIASLRKRVGEKQFEALRVQVERGPEQVVEQALREMLNEQG
jgi:tetratricopeptide (TPR) repeat protein